MSSWTAASSDCSRPVNNYVHVKTADLYRPNARLTPERQGYQVLTPFGKLGHSLIAGGWGSGSWHGQRRESRPGGQEGFQPHGGHHDVPDPKLKAHDRAEVPHRPVRRTVAAQAAAVQRRRDQARTVRVGELGVGRTGQADPGSQVEVFSAAAGPGN